MHFYPNERIGLFLDGANLFACLRALGFMIDYKRMLAAFGQTGRLVRAVYYLVLTEDQSARPFAGWLQYNGFTVVTKTAKEYTDELGRRKIRGNLDVELAVDALRLGESFDHIVLFSGDSDYCRLVAALQRKGRRVSVVSTMRTQPPMAADELRRQADQFIELADLKSLIARSESASLTGGYK
jgi:uncharacterized LabA/DUF88 family protein